MKRKHKLSPVHGCDVVAFVGYRDNFLHLMQGYAIEELGFDLFEVCSTLLSSCSLLRFLPSVHYNLSVCDGYDLGKAHGSLKIHSAGASIYSEAASVTPITRFLCLAEISMFTSVSN